MAISYSAVGSSAGIAAFSARRVDFGASDVPLNAAEQAAAHGGGAVQVPVDLGAAFVVYNLVLPGTGRLRLSGPVIARIFLGQITRWNDPAIVALNPGADIPDVPVNVVHRSDGSGTTYIFSNYLSAVDPAWASRIGTGKSLHWPVGVGVRGKPRCRAGRRAHAVLHRLHRTVLLQRPDPQLRRYPQPGRELHHALYGFHHSRRCPETRHHPADFSIVNEPGPNSYPICGYSWALIYIHQASQATGKALVTLLDWLTHQGQAYAAATSYVPLPPRIQTLARAMLRQVTGPNGAHLLS